MNQQKMDQLNNYCQSHKDWTCEADEKLLSFARKQIKKTSAANLDEAFMQYASLNYLNACQGQEAIKNAIPIIVRGTKNVGGLNLYLDGNRSMLYARFFNFIFSFKATTLPSDLSSWLRSKPVIRFDNIRKQPCADYILRFAMGATSCGPLKQSSSKEGSASSKPTSTKNKASAEAVHHAKFDWRNISPNYLLDKAPLNMLCTTSMTTDNITAVLSFIYFSYDILKNCDPKLPSHISSCLCRSLIVESYSIIDALEIELGAKHLGVVRNKSGNTYGDDKRFRAEFEKHYLRDSETRKAFNEFRDLRNNVHLSKRQNIKDDPNYTRERAAIWIDKMIRFINMLVDRFC